MFQTIRVFKPQMIHLSQDSKDLPWFRILSFGGQLVDVRVSFVIAGLLFRF